MLANHGIQNKLKFYREQCKLRQVDVARELGLECADRISRWAKGNAVPHIINLFKLSVLYKALPHELYGDLYDLIEADHGFKKAVRKP
jgi:transcriptional regulator with XRE-family HTH domain